MLSKGLKAYEAQNPKRWHLERSEEPGIHYGYFPYHGKYVKVRFEGLAPIHLQPNHDKHPMIQFMTKMFHPGVDEEKGLLYCYGLLTWEKIG